MNKIDGGHATERQMAGEAAGKFRDLVAAVITQALQDIGAWSDGRRLNNHGGHRAKFGRFGVNPAKAEQYRLEKRAQRSAFKDDALSWIKSDDPAQWSFRWCCEQLGCDPEVMRSTIMGRIGR